VFQNCKWNILHIELWIQWFLSQDLHARLPSWQRGLGTSLPAAVPSPGWMRAILGRWGIWTLRDAPILRWDFSEQTYTKMEGAPVLELMLAWEVVEHHADAFKGHLSLWYPYLDEAINFRNRQMSLLVGHFDRRLPTWSTACVDFRCSISDTLCRVDRKSAKLWCAPMGKVSSKLGDGLQLTQKVTNKQPTIGSGVFPHPTRVYHGIPNNFVEPYLGCTWAPGINLNASRKSTSFG
jgi:hypothetical protein